MTNNQNQPDIHNQLDQDGLQDFNFFSIFNDVFTSRTQLEKQELYLSGIAQFDINRISIPRPWLFFRVFMSLTAMFALVYIISAFGGILSLPTLMFLGALIVPFTLIVLFFELNVYRDISIFSIIKMFGMGGALAVIFTLILHDLIGYNKGMDYLGALLTGVVEEAAKVAVVYFAMLNHKNKTISNGLLTGAAIGGGFASIESAGYAFLGMFLNFSGYPAIIYSSQYLAISVRQMLDVLYLRCILAPGGHIIWAAIEGAAIAMVLGKKSKDKNKTNLKSLGLILFCVLLHSLWNMPLKFVLLPARIYFVPLVLTILAWSAGLRLIKAGINEAFERKNKTQAQNIKEPSN
ncbi:MAG TPA: PrsW family glutamic-type intramembrane protease [Clostridia bacterium]